MNMNYYHNRRRNTEKLMSNINITPLVDVMLVLLIVFMVTAPMLISGVNVDLPQTKSIPIKNRKDDPLFITLDKKGDIYIMDTLIDRHELLAKLKAIVKEKYDNRIFIKGDKSLSYGKIMEVIGELSFAGFNKVALITSAKTDDKRPK